MVYHRSRMTCLLTLRSAEHCSGLWTGVLRPICGLAVTKWLFSCLTLLELSSHTTTVANQTGALQTAEWDYHIDDSSSACNRSFSCMKATYLYAVKNQGKAENVPCIGLLVPWAFCSISMISTLNKRGHLLKLTGIYLEDSDEYCRDINSILTAYTSDQ